MNEIIRKLFQTSSSLILSISLCSLYYSAVILFLKNYKKYSELNIWYPEPVQSLGTIMVDTRMRELQETQKRFDQALQEETQRRDEVEKGIQEQIGLYITQIHDHIRHLDEKQTSFNNRFEEHMLTADERFNNFTSSLNAIQVQMSHIVQKLNEPTRDQSIFGESPSVRRGEGPTHITATVERQANRPNPHTNPLFQATLPSPRIDFPKFDGSNARDWVVKCMGYFELMPSTSDIQKVTIATLHFEGKAALWYQNYRTRLFGLRQPSGYNITSRSIG